MLHEIKRHHTRIATKPEIQTSMFISSTASPVKKEMSPNMITGNALAALGMKMVLRPAHKPNNTAICF